MKKYVFEIPDEVHYEMGPLDSGAVNYATVSPYLVSNYGSLVKTGQTIVYRAGDDGTYQAGDDISPRFVDNGDNTITDESTGLMWVMDQANIGGVWGTPETTPGAHDGTPITMVWNHAIDNCEALDYAGHSDWRLPNAKELLTIVDYSRIGPSVNGTFFPNTRSGVFWSSTTFAGNTINAWYVDFRYGDVNSDGKGGAYYVRAVRGG